MFAHVNETANVGAKLSVVIPVFNSAPYLRRLLNSLAQQSYRNWEALFVDDGSNDASLDILRDAAGNESRIRLFSIEHQGSSGARNKALENASGELVAFVDADDFIHPDMFQVVVQHLSVSPADAVMFDFAPVSPEAEFQFTRVCEDETWQCIENIIEWSLIPWHPYAHSIWHTVYRRNVLEGLKFYPRIKHQDLLFSYQAFGRVKRMDYLQHVLYAYVQSPGSVIRSKYSKEKIDSTVAIIHALDAHYSTNTNVRKLLRCKLYPRLVSNMWKLSERSDDVGLIAIVKQAVSELWSAHIVGLNGFSLAKQMKMIRTVFL